LDNLLEFFQSMCDVGEQPLPFGSPHGRQPLQRLPQRLLHQGPDGVDVDFPLFDDEHVRKREDLVHLEIGVAAEELSRFPQGLSVTPEQPRIYPDRSLFGTKFLYRDENFHPSTLDVFGGDPPDPLLQGLIPFGKLGHDVDEAVVDGASLDLNRPGIAGARGAAVTGHAEEQRVPRPPDSRLGFWCARFRRAPSISSSRRPGAPWPEGSPAPGSTLRGRAPAPSRLWRAALFRRAATKRGRRSPRGASPPTPPRPRPARRCPTGPARAAAAARSGTGRRRPAGSRPGC